MKRYRHIDALRGIAIITVILCHSHPYFAGISNYKLSPVIDYVIMNGDKGVTLFFLISAFTLCLSLNAKKDTEHKPLRNYFISRIFRIVPMYYFTIVLFLILRLENPSTGSILANIFFIHGLNPYWINSSVPGGWSVGIEVIFYLLFPLLFLRIKTIAGAINLTMICVLIAKLVTSLMAGHPLISDGNLWGVYIYENIVSQLPVFLIGICLFHIQTIRKQLSESPGVYSSLLFIGLLMVSHLLGGNIFKLHYLFAIAFGFIAMGLYHYEAKAMVNKFTIITGKLSYSMYLTHLVVANLLVRYHLNHYNANPLIELAARFLIIFVLSFILSNITYRLIELPFQTYGKRLIQKLEQPKIYAERV